MPRGTKVDKVYRALLKEGHSKGSAAKIAQSNYFGVEYGVFVKGRREPTETVDSQMRRLNHLKSFALTGGSRLWDSGDRFYSICE